MGEWTLSSSGETIDGVTVLPGAVVSLAVVSGGSVSGFVVSSGGALSVEFGGSANDAVVDSGGTLFLDGGAASGAVVSSGGDLAIPISSAYGPWTPSSGGETIDGVTALPGAAISLELEPGGSISGFVVASGGSIFVAPGAAASGTIIDSGGSEIIEPGGSDAGVVVSGGDGVIGSGGPFGTSASLENYGSVTGSQSGVGVEVEGGGSVLNAGSISGSTAAVEFVGSGLFALELQGGSTLAGAVIGSTASGATNALVLQGTGTANTNFNNFTTLNVQAGGAWTLGGNSTIGATTVWSGGTLIVTGDLTGPVTLAGGGAAATFNTGFQSDITFEGADALSLSQPYGGTIAGFGIGDTIDLTGLQYDQSASSYAVAAGSGADNYVVTVDEGTSSYSLQFNESTPATLSEFTLSADANGDTEILGGVPTVRRRLRRRPRRRFGRARRRRYPGSESRRAARRPARPSRLR